MGKGTKAKRAHAADRAATGRRDRDPRQRRHPFTVLAVAALAVAGIGGVILATTRPAPAPRVERYSHVHGLDAPAWAGGDLLVATHTGLVRVTPAGEWLEAGGERHDLMGFRAHPTDPGVLFGSGHPDLRSGMPNPLGVVRSRDAGRTWEALALTGRVDFHAMAVRAPAAETLYGFDVSGGPALHRSDDGGTTWRRVAGDLLAAIGGVNGLEVDPGDPDTVLAGTMDGLWRSGDGGVTWQRLAFDGVPVTEVRVVSADSETLIAYVHAPGHGLVRSDDRGATWRSLASPAREGDVVVHLASGGGDPEVLYAATLQMDVMASRDGGDTWEVLGQEGVPRPASSSATSR